MHVNILEDHRWAKFRVEQGHSKVYLPEQLLLAQTEYLRWHKSMKQLEGVSFEEQRWRIYKAKAKQEGKLKEKKREHDGGKALAIEVRPSFPSGQHVDISTEYIKDQRAILIQYIQEKQRRQTNITGSNQVPYAATPAVTHGAPSGAGMPHDEVTHPSTVGRGFAERSGDHQHHNLHARQEQSNSGGVDHGQRHLSPQNPTDHNYMYNSKSSDGRDNQHIYQHQGSNSGQHQPAGTNQPPPTSPNLAINPAYSKIPPGNSTAPYGHLSRAKMPHSGQNQLAGANQSSQSSPNLAIYSSYGEISPATSTAPSYDCFQAKMPNASSDDHQHKERPTPAPRHIPIMDRQQQPEKQLPSWPTMETVVVVRNAKFQNPVTGAVKFIGHVQGFDEFVVGLELVSCMCA